MKKLTLRVDDDLHQELIEWAKRENRSLHAQLLTIVQQAVEVEKSAARSESL